MKKVSFVISFLVYFLSSSVSQENQNDYFGVSTPKKNEGETRFQSSSSCATLIETLKKSVIYIPPGTFETSKGLPVETIFFEITELNDKKTFLTQNLITSRNNEKFTSIGLLEIQAYDSVHQPLKIVDGKKIWVRQVADSDIDNHLSKLIFAKIPIKDKKTQYNSDLKSFFNKATKLTDVSFVGVDNDMLFSVAPESLLKGTKCNFDKYFKPSPGFEYTVTELGTYSITKDLSAVGVSSFQIEVSHPDCTVYILLEHNLGIYMAQKTGKFTHSIDGIPYVKGVNLIAVHKESGDSYFFNRKRYDSQSINNSNDKKSIIKERLALSHMNASMFNQVFEAF
jgi:hypothetical protein